MDLLSYFRIPQADLEELETEITASIETIGGAEAI
jgi:hypothetical protein